MGEATKEYSGVDFMKQAGINSIYRQLKNIKFPPKHSSQEEKAEFVTRTTETFLDEYVLPECDVEKLDVEISTSNSMTERNTSKGATLQTFRACNIIAINM